MVFMGKSVCVRAKGKMGDALSLSLSLCFYIFYIVSLQRQPNIPVTDGQHVILMLSLWQQLKVKLRHSCKRQNLRVIKQTALF